MGILYLGQISFLCQSYHMPLNTHKLKPRKVKRGGVDLIEGEFCTYAAHQYHFTPPWTFIIFSFFIDGFYVVLQFLLHGPTPLFFHSFWVMAGRKLVVLVNKKED